MKFSSVLDEISNVCSVYVDQRLSGITGLSGDSQISVLQLSSIVVDKITHKIIDESGQEKVVSADAISMFKFNEPEGLGDKKHPWELSTHDFVLRKHDGSNMYLEYWPLSNVLSCQGGCQLSDIVGDSQVSELQLSSAVVDTIQRVIVDDSGMSTLVSADAVSLFKFNDPEGIADRKYLQELSSHDMLLRHHDGQKLILEYWPLSNVLSAGVGAEISVDTEIPNQTSSLQKLSTDEGEWYQLYNFDKTAVDLTVASDINGPGRWYAPAPTGLTDASALFLVKDT